MYLTTYFELWEQFMYRVIGEETRNRVLSRNNSKWNMSHYYLNPMQNESEIQDQILQLANNICSLLNIPVFLNLSSITKLFNEKIYYDIIAHLHPTLQQHLHNLQTQHTTTVKRFQALITVMQKLLGDESLDHIKVQRIVQRDARMTLRFIECLYQYVKKRLNSRKQNEGSSEILLSESEEEDESVYQRIINQEKETPSKGKKKKKRKKRVLNQVKSATKLSSCDYMGSREKLKAIQRIQSSKPSSYFADRFLNDEIERRHMELKIKEKEMKSSEQKQKILRAKSKELQQINEAKKRRSQNQKEMYLQQCIEREEKSLEYKIRDQKSLYLRKINSALVKLEREKRAEEGKNLRDRKNEQNRQLEMEIESIRSYYQSQISLTREGEQEQRRNRALVDRAYRQIAMKLQKQLRDDNLQKMRLASVRSQGDLLKWQDMDKVEQSIRQIYKKYS